MLKYFWVTLLILTVLFFPGCINNPSSISEVELLKMLEDALMRERSYVTDIQVLAYDEFEGKKVALFYYKIGERYEIEDLKEFELSKDEITLIGGSSKMMTDIDRTDVKLTMSSAGFMGYKNTNNYAVVYGRTLDPAIETIEITFQDGTQFNRDISENGGYIVFYYFNDFLGVHKINGLDSEGEIIYEFPPNND
jgi:hypothetical protein